MRVQVGAEDGAQQRRETGFTLPAVVLPPLFERRSVVHEPARSATTIEGRRRPVTRYDILHITLGIGS